jgi:hypothetical protein
MALWDPDVDLELEVPGTYTTTGTTLNTRRAVYMSTSLTFEFE